MAELLVTVAGVALIAALAWFFFGPRAARGAEVRGGSQEVEITVKGGYSPNLIRVREGVPVRLVFDRQEAGDCTSRVVFPDFGISRSLAPFTRTAVEFTPDRRGEFGFACGMNMVHGALLVEADPAGGQDGGTPQSRLPARGRSGIGAIDLHRSGYLLVAVPFRGAERWLLAPPPAARPPIIAFCTSSKSFATRRLIRRTASQRRQAHPPGIESAGGRRAPRRRAARLRLRDHKRVA